MVDSDQDGGVNRVAAGRVLHTGAAAQSKVECFESGFVSSDVEDGLWIRCDEVAEGPSMIHVVVGALGVVVIHGD
jgi:hypothetical protein